MDASLSDLVKSILTLEMMEIRNNNYICSANGMICCFSVTGVKTTKMTSIIHN